MHNFIFEPVRAASPLFASGGAVSVDLDPTFIAHLVIFAAFTVLMKDLIFDPLLKVFEERERRTAGAIGQARDMDEHSIALKQEYEGKLEGVRRDAAVDREQARTKVKRVQDELMTEARGAVGKTLDAGMASLSEEAGKIRADLETQRGTLAAQIASRVLGREVESAAEVKR